MNRWLLIPVATMLLVLAADTRPAHGLVIMSVLPKGHVPQHRFPEPVTSLLGERRPIHGRTIDGFSHYTCLLYYRGTQENVQELIDGLGELADITLVVKLDRTGKVGLLTSQPAFPLDRPIAYLYEVHVHCNNFVEAAEQPAGELEKLVPAFNLQSKTSVTVTVFSAGGLKLDQLRLPASATIREQPQAVKQAEPAK